LTGAKISRGLLLAVLALQIAVYFFAQYVEYLLFRSTLPAELAPSFWSWFDATTRAFAWAERNGQAGVPFGVWGYGMRALEIAGFALGGLVAPAILFAVPYCGECSAYMKSKQIGMIPAGVPRQKIKKSNTEALQAYTEAHQQALVRADGLVRLLLQSAQEGKADAVAQQLAEHADKKKEMLKSTSYVTVQLQRCPCCSAGNLVLNLSSNPGDPNAVTEVGRTTLKPEFVRDLQTYSRSAT
jgi:hypothetical protein